MRLLIFRYLSHRLYENNNLTNEEKQTLDGFFGNSEKLDLPLRLSFLISPLYLLIPKLLHKSKYDHEPLAMVCLALTYVFHS